MRWRKNAPQTEPHIPSQKDDADHSGPHRPSCNGAFTSGYAECSEVGTKSTGKKDRGDEASAVSVALPVAPVRGWCSRCNTRW